jgi:hypothetical protein
MRISLLYRHLDWGIYRVNVTTYQHLRPLSSFLQSRWIRKDIKASWGTPIHRHLVNRKPKLGQIRSQILDDELGAFNLVIRHRRNVDQFLMELEQSSCLV